MSSETELEVVEGIEGNVYEMLPEEALYTAETKKRDREEAAEKGPDLEAAAKAKSVVEAGAAAPDHGKPAGAGNALTFHSWDGDKPADKDEE